MAAKKKTAKKAQAVRKPRKARPPSKIEQPKAGTPIGVWTSVGDLKMGPNPRVNEERVPRVMASIKRFGFNAPIVADEKTKVILAGHTRYKVAIKLGLERVPVRFVTLTGNDLMLYKLADNKLGEDVPWDDQMLARIISKLWKEDRPGVQTAGFTDATVARIINEAKKKDPEPPAAPEKPKQAVTQPGDVWKLGDHLLLCGDSTNRDQVIAFLNGARPACLFTDPPYGVMHGRGGLKGVNAIRGDLSQAVIPVSFAIANEVLAEDARIYMCGGSENLQMYWTLWDHHLHLAPRIIVWVKDSFVLRRHNYHSQFEFIYFGWKGTGGGVWYGDRKQSDVWTVARKKETEHSTEKPVELAARAITNSTKPGSLVFDPFLGSGSTLIAAERLERRCVGIELDGAWCDVIVQRWERFTEKKAERIPAASAAE